MSVFIKEFSSRQELEDFIQDKIVGDVPIDPTVGVNVRGLTLVFTTPAKTVTFPNTAVFGAARPAQIVAEINTQASLAISSIKQYGHGRGGRDSRIALIRTSDVLASGTAIAALGLSAGTVGADEIALAKIVDIGVNPVSASWYIAYDA